MTRVFGEVKKGICMGLYVHAHMCTHAYTHAHTPLDPRKGDKVEVLSRAFIHPGVHVMPLNKLSHPCYLLSKY